MPNRNLARPNPMMRAAVYHGPNGLTCPVGILRQDQVPAQQDIAPPT